MLFTVSTKPVLSVVFSNIGSTKTLLLPASVKTLKLTRLHAEIVSSWLGLQRPWNYCSDTIVATRSVHCYSYNSLSFSNLDFVVVVSAANVVLFFFLVLAKMAVSDVSQKYDVIIRIFEILKYQNIPVLTVWPIVPITFLILNNHQSGRLAAKNSNSAEIAFFTFWSNVTYSPDSPVNVLIESRNVRKMVTVSSNRIYKMHEITLIHVTSTHCRT